MAKSPAGPIIDLSGSLPAQPNRRRKQPTSQVTGDGGVLQPGVTKRVQNTNSNGAEGGTQGNPPESAGAGYVGAPKRKRGRVRPREEELPVASGPGGPDLPTEPDGLADEEFQEHDANFATTQWRRAPWWARLTSTLLVVGVLMVVSFEVVYAGKIYPGVTADGITLAGLTRDGATARITDKTNTFTGEVITVSASSTTLPIPINSLEMHYDSSRAAALAVNFGRTGSLLDRLHAQARALLGRPTNFAVYNYDDASLVPYLTQLNDNLATPVEDASLTFDNGQAQVTPSQAGTRLDLGLLEQLINDRLATTDSNDTVTAPVYQLQPNLTTGPLRAASGQITSYLASPITLSYNGSDRIIDQQTLISWLNVGSSTSKPFLQTLKLQDVYPPPPSASITLDHSAVQAYVKNLAAGIDQNAQNAQLAMQDGQLNIVAASQPGIKLDQGSALNDILGSLKDSSKNREISLHVQTVQADVNESNLETLGIKEQISEGETTFPGSPPDRLINIKVGAARFNDVLLKPGETFSFGKILGDVGPLQGYVPELVILANHEEKQYGGGLCQVATTAYRAALLAGLPIVERHNHSFAVSYYTAPYGVPGVDATIYYPQVDLKFTNDTSHYILIQTTMQGTDLKFNFFGTKTKSGTIRGPEFVSGTNDTKQASHTVFYRDVLDLSGNVTKTDTISTYYQPSTDYPVLKQYN
jgi:vancomycin resistance protein YoaR